MKKIIKKTLCILLAAIILCPAFIGCGKTDDRSSQKISFRDATKLEDLRKMNGQTVTINGYIATSSPADGSFIFLMNLPYQSCPFCVPNTSQLANTIEVYPKKGEKLDYSSQAVKVTGTLVVADEGASPFTDPYEYEFYYKIVDADYTIIKTSELSGKMKIWEKVASSDVVNDLYDMLDYISFVTCWPEYYQNNYYDDTGALQPGYYLYASDAKNAITNANGYYHYGYVDGYFEGIRKKLKKIDETELADIIAIVTECETLAATAVTSLLNGEYTEKYQYVEMFGTNDYIYTLNRGEEFMSQYDNLYYKFSDWMNSWEI